MAVSWSLEEELCGLVNANSTVDALLRMGLSDQHSALPILEETHGWKRGGAETYIYRFKVVSSDEARNVLLKAVTAFSLSRTLNEISDDWLSRRRLLAAAGVVTPHLYYVGRSLLVEEDVGLSLAAVLRRKPRNAAKLADQVLHIAAVMDRHRFAPLSPFGSLCTDGRTVYLVDFGQDLGPPNVRHRKGRPLLHEARRWLATNGCVVDQRRAEAVYTFHLDAERTATLGTQQSI